MDTTLPDPLWDAQLQQIRQQPYEQRRVLSAAAARVLHDAELSRALTQDAQRLLSETFGHLPDTHQLQALRLCGI